MRRINRDAGTDCGALLFLRSLLRQRMDALRGGDVNGERSAVLGSVFLVVAILAGIFGFGGIALTAAGIAQALFLIRLIIFVVALIMGLMSDVGRPWSNATHHGDAEPVPGPAQGPTPGGLRLFWARGRMADGPIEAQDVGAGRGRAHQEIRCRSGGTGKAARLPSSGRNWPTMCVDCAGRRPAPSISRS